MSKLYPSNNPPPVFVTKEEEPSLESSWPTDEDFQQFRDCTHAYCSITNLYSSVASEAYTLVEPKNRRLFNAYTELLCERLGVQALPEVPEHALESRSLVAVNAEISLEGWIGNLWQKIKNMFSSIYNKIKEFFKRHFTRLGRTKKGLENLIKVLDKSEKNLKNPQMDGYSGKLLKLYAGYGAVNAPNVKKSLTNVGKLTNALVNVNKAAKTLADKHMVDREFFNRMKNLKDRAKGSAEVASDVKDSKNKGLSAVFNGDKRRENSEKNKEIKSLTEISKASAKEGGDMETKVSGYEQGNEESKEGNEDKAGADFAVFMESVKKEISVVINTPLISGKVIKGVKSEDKGKVEIEMGESEEDATSLTLGAKSDLLAAAREALKMVIAAEQESKAFGSVNDSIDKNMSALDSLISDIDRIDPEKFGSYKKMLDEQIRKRLTLLRDFFSLYNKVGKSVLTLSMDAGGGVIDYSVLSMKKFG